MTLEEAISIIKQELKLSLYANELFIGNLQATQTILNYTEHESIPKKALEEKIKELDTEIKEYKALIRNQEETDVDYYTMLGEKVAMDILIKIVKGE